MQQSYERNSIERRNKGDRKTNYERKRERDLPQREREREREREGKNEREICNGIEEELEVLG